MNDPQIMQVNQSFQTLPRYCLQETEIILKQMVLGTKLLLVKDIVVFD
jgi:hypothetical protein